MRVVRVPVGSGETPPPRAAELGPSIHPEAVSVRTLALLRDQHGWDGAAGCDPRQLQDPVDLAQLRAHRQAWADEVRRVALDHDRRPICFVEVPPGPSDGDGASVLPSDAQWWLSNGLCDVVLPALPAGSAVYATTPTTLPRLLALTAPAEMPLAVTWRVLDDLRLVRVYRWHRWSVRDVDGRGPRRWRPEGNVKRHLPDASVTVWILGGLLLVALVVVAVARRGGG